MTMNSLVLHMVCVIPVPLEESTRPWGDLPFRIQAKSKQYHKWKGAHRGTIACGTYIHATGNSNYYGERKGHPRLVCMCIHLVPNPPPHLHVCKGKGGPAMCSVSLYSKLAAGKPIRESH